MSDGQLAALESPVQASALSEALQARESAQVQVAALMAMKNPRNELEATDRIMNACTRTSLAEGAIYDYARGGSKITGPTIRLAEAIAQCWGNLDFGWREVHRSVGADGVGCSFIEAYAWDLQSNTRVPRTFTVRHWRDTKGGGYLLKDERDIYELCANYASRRVRACILAVVPGDLVERAVAQCGTTLAADAKNDADAQKRIVEVFAEYGVSKAQIEARIQCRLDAITPAQVVSLRRIINSLKAGMSSADEWFEAKEDVPTEVDPFSKESPKTEKVAHEDTKAPSEPPTIAEEQEELM